MMKIKFATDEKNTDFILQTNSRITPTELLLRKLEHVLNYSLISR